MASSEVASHAGAAGQLGTLAFVVKNPGLLQGESPTAFVACRDIPESLARQRKGAYCTSHLQISCLALYGVLWQSIAGNSKPGVYLDDESILLSRPQGIDLPAAIRSSISLKVILQFGHKNTHRHREHLLNEYSSKAFQHPKEAIPLMYTQGTKGG